MYVEFSRSFIFLFIILYLVIINLMKYFMVKLIFYLLRERVNVLDDGNVEALNLFLDVIWFE